MLKTMAFVRTMLVLVSVLVALTAADVLGQSEPGTILVIGGDNTALWARPVGPMGLLAREYRSVFRERDLKIDDHSIDTLDIQLELAELRGGLSS